MDIVYTLLYVNPINPRTKVSWIYKLDNSNKLRFDYALFGSSRCVHHIDPKLIDLSTGLNGINLGYAASKPLEVKLMVETFLKKFKPKKIFVQIDYTYNEESNSNLATVPWLPIIGEDYVYNELKKVEPKSFRYKYIPFYRYARNESKIGFRSVFLNLSKKNDFTYKKGFVPTHGSLINKNITPEFILQDSRNRHLTEIEEICERKGVQLYFFTSPMNANFFNFEIIKKYYSSYENFSNSISDKNFFRDNTHLNEKGAELFTQIFIDYYFNKNKSK
ncbi:hypothetical protein [Flavobacterium sp. CS20]|uniref:hypothetical protein n=1 Tax=Flavobacterium sp. CS20 TaxID=2775246 RepID=UPI001B39FE3E|nr:hypothetical protein [Flavobacterium sp. CS20]QTY28141.1 hypothetical protein IGB25_06550 [Flavobacterium sp. CS20]